MKNINEYINENLVKESNGTFYYVSVGSEDSYATGWIHLDENGNKIDEAKYTNDIFKVIDTVVKNIIKGAFKSYKKDEEGNKIDRVAIWEGDDKNDTSNYDCVGEYDLYGRMI